MLRVTSWIEGCKQTCVNFRVFKKTKSNLGKKLGSENAAG